MQIIEETLNQFCSTIPWQIQLSQFGQSWEGCRDEGVDVISWQIEDFEGDESFEIGVDDEADVIFGQV